MPLDLLENLKSKPPVDLLADDPIPEPKENKSVYLEDRDETVSYPAGTPLDQVNSMIQKQIYQKPAVNFYELPIAAGRVVGEEIAQEGLVTAAKEVAKAGVRGVEGLGAGAGSLTRWFGEIIENDADKDFAFDHINASLVRDFETIKKPEGMRNFQRVVGERIADWGITAHKFFIEQTQTGIEAADPEIFSGSFIDNPSWIRGVSLVAEAMPSLAAATAITFATKSPTAGAAALGLLEGSGTYEEARQAGKTVDEATGLGTAAVVMLTILETLPLTRFLRRGGPGKPGLLKMSKDVFIGSTQEGSEEVAQQLWQNLLAKVGYDKTRDLTEGLLESFIAGAGSGGMMGGVTSGRGKQVDRIIKEALEKGVTEAELEQIKDIVRNQVINNKEEIEGLLNKEATRIKKLNAEEAEAIEAMGPELEKEVPLAEPVAEAEEVEPTPEERVTAFAEEVRAEREAEPAQIPETKEEAEVREAQETIFFEEERRKRFKEISKFRRPKGGLFKEELKQVSRSFFTTDPNAESIDEAAERLNMTANELIDELQEASRRDVGSAETIRQAKITIKESRRKQTLRQKREVIREKIEKKRADVEEIKRDLIDFITTNLRLDFRGRRELFQKVKNVKTEKQLLTAMARVDQLAEQQGRRIGIARLRKELKTTAAKKVSGKLTGKFTPAVQEYLDIARDMVKLSPAEAQAKLAENMEKAREGFPPVEIAVQNEILSLVAGLETKTSAEIQTALETIRGVKEIGRRSNALKQLVRKTKQADINKMAENIITGGQAAVKIESSRSESADDKVSGWWNRLLPSQLSWRNLMNRLSIKDKTSAREESKLSKATKVSHIETVEKKGRRQWLNKFIKAYQTVYGKMSESQMQKRFAEDSVVRSLGVFKDKNNQQIDLRLSKAEARKRYMELQDPTLDDSFSSEEGMAYTDDMQNAIIDSLNEKDRQFADLQLDLYQEYYKRFNKVFSAMNGVNLPKIPLYSPIARETGRKAELAVNEFLDEIPIRQGITPGAGKVRVKNVFKLRELGDVWVFQRHIRDVEHYVAWAEKIRELNGIFGDPSIRQSIVKHHGKCILHVIDGFIEDFTRGQIDRSHDTSWLNTLKNNYVVSTLMLKTAIGVKQLMSFPAFADGIPAHEFMIGLLDFASNPVEKIKILATSELMQARGLNITQEMSEAAATTEYRKLSAAFTKVKSFRRLAMLMVRIGDRGAIYFGGWSVYRYNRVVLKKGHKASLQAFEEATASAQQSTDLSELSQFQRGNSWQRLFAVFHSSQNQYFRKELTATQDFIGGRLSAKKYAKFILIYHFILPMFFQFAADGLKFRPEEQKRAALLGAFNGWFIIGEVMNSALRALLGLKVWDQKTPASSVFDGFIRALQKMNADDFTPEDYAEVIAKASVSVGELSGLGVKQGLNVKQGFAEISDGNFEKGFKLIAGWSEYVIDGDNPEGSGRKFKR